MRTGSEQDIDALTRGEQVPADRIYFRTCPRLSTSADSLSWMNGTLFVATGERLPNSVELDVYQLT